MAPEDMVIPASDYQIVLMPADRGILPRLAQNVHPLQSTSAGKRLDMRQHADPSVSLHGDCLTPGISVFHQLLMAALSLRGLASAERGAPDHRPNHAFILTLLSDSVL